ncbi:MAG: DNA-protecting protein DprA [Hyphomicrobiales bacterium]|nr:DNA-protecting protein DprA [Hyphomicrobiales bacterium]
MSKGSKPARLDDEQRFDWLRLIRSENVGPRTFRALIERYASARAALAALPDLARRGGAKRPIRVATIGEIERELTLAQRLGVRFIALGEPEYPPALRQIDAAPPVLALLGREEALQQPAVAIVGSRNASAAGLTFADRLARGLGLEGYVVVSGLARGVDQRAHVAALPTGTIGVLAGGLAKPYPPEATVLLPRIAEYGAVLSEMPIEWEPRGRDFPRRNRIVSGLSLGTVIVEAARGSGSLITARFAAEQNREVFAVPGSPLDPRAEGTNDLLREGANLCARPEDVLAVLDPLRARDPFGTLEESGDPLWSETDLFGVDPDATPRSESVAEPVDDGASEPAASPLSRIEALLGPSPVSIDDLARAAEVSPREIRAVLIELELAGRIEHHGGDRVAFVPPAAD